MSLTDQLVALGLNKNEGKALDALISLGPAGASDVHKYSGVPRNKAYETLERLVQRGMVEIQEGRPTLYRARDSKEIVNSLLEEYSKEAKQALSILQKKQQDLLENKNHLAETASAWMIRGELQVKKRLAELICDAKEDIFAISGYPAKYLLAVKSALKAATKKGLNTRAVCMMSPFGAPEFSSDDASIIEFRTLKTSSKSMQNIDLYDQKLLGSFRKMSGYGGMVIIDEATAFDIVDLGSDPNIAIGIIFKAPGIPCIQKATVERILGLYTRKI